MGRLIFVIGSAGAGKTTIAKELARFRGAAFLDMDTFARPASEKLMTLAGLDPEDRDSDEYKELCRDLGYRMTMNAALENVELGNDAIVIGPFTRETESREWLENELRSLGEKRRQAIVKVVYVYLSDPELYRRRIIERRLASDEWKLRHWDRFRQSLAIREIRWELPDGSVLYLDNEGELDEAKRKRLYEFIYGNSDSTPYSDSM
ncbi:hypothetical protein ELR57_12235 [Cohnella sp. AR92]|nr:AAA family ATPase [Cohnella sp. AR92]RUS47211.1 hypothetical protein ELR57_12235 [Cohnella sp. AR92]